MSINAAHIRVITMLVAVVSASAAGVVACQSAVNLDVKYTDAGPAPLPDGAPGVPVNDAEPGPELQPKNGDLEGCPCDETQGLGCCASSVGPAFCTADQDRCNLEKGAFYRCFGPDLNSESTCCWHGAGAGATTALAAMCDAGATACTADKHCPVGVTCVKKTCFNVTVGACGQDPPACPPGG